ncbi:MAG: heparinase II/III-family protein [Chloroflexi bacterium]|nr:heparinase II/III-family protein [Chloroflexota bacterium]
MRAALLDREAWRPFPKVADRVAWAGLPQDLQAELVQGGERHLGNLWPELPATLFLDFKRNGNRSRYEARHFARRQVLRHLVLAECVEGRGRFLDDIVNGVWALCEESFWGVPAHNYSDREPWRGSRGAGGIGLPDTAFPNVDLFAAETAALLGWTLYLLSDEIGSELPVVVDRVLREEQVRILQPYRTLDSWRWLGKNGRRPNNWNPWIHSNILAVNLLLESDAEVRRATVLRIIEGLDFFLNGYHDDGGCDEGPSYWGRAGGSLYDCLELLRSATAGRLNAFTLPLVQQIGRYPYRVHISGDWYVNFADAPARVYLDGGILYRYGKAIDDPLLEAHGAFTWQQSLVTRQGPGRESIGRMLNNIFFPAPVTPPAQPPLVGEAWQDGVQVLTVREHPGSSQGLYVAAKGGHNGESHNHNDVGNFVVAVDGEPVLIDVGVETYTRFTFGPERYTIWTMRSLYHNLPHVDGIEQSPGEEFCARDVTAQIGVDGGNITLDLARAYPPSAGIEQWHRSVGLKRSGGGSVELEDSFELSRQPKDLTLHLMARGPVEERTLGVLRCSSPTRPLDVQFDPEEFTVSSERIAINDARLEPAWGEAVWRIVLSSRRPRMRGSWRVSCRAAASES